VKQLFRILALALLLASAGGAVHADDRKTSTGAQGSTRQDLAGEDRYARHADDDDDDKGRGRGRGRDDDDDRKRGDDDSRERVSLSEAVKMAKRQYGADVVRAEARSEGGRTVYHLLLHSEGRVWTVRVDARTGEMY
jgi:uncharacterized membrane protein YkoI